MSFDDLVALYAASSAMVISYFAKFAVKTKFEFYQCYLLPGAYFIVFNAAGIYGLTVIVVYYGYYWYEYSI